MNNSRLLAALFLALPLAATAQTKPAAAHTKPAATPAKPVITQQPATQQPGTQQQTEVTEDLDPATGKVIRRTTRTINVPIGTPAATTPTATTTEALTASDAQVSSFFREKTTVATLTAPALLDAYARFIDKVRNDRHAWKSADWSAAAAVLSSLNARYDQLRASLTLDDKLTIRSQQAEFQALRTARQLSDQVSDKL